MNTKLEKKTIKEISDLFWTRMNRIAREIEFHPAGPNIYTVRLNEINSYLMNKKKSELLDLIEFWGIDVKNTYMGGKNSLTTIISNFWQKVGRIKIAEYDKK